MKKNLNLSIDYHVIQKARKLFPNQISDKVEDYLRNLINYANNNKLGIKKELLLLDIEKIEKEIFDKSSELSSLKYQLNIIEDDEKMKQKEDLIKQQEEADKLITCSICGIPKLEEKIHDLPGGVVCNACFMTGDSNTLKKYLKNDI